MVDEKRMCPFVDGECLRNCMFQNTYGECLLAAVVEYIVDKMITESVEGP